MIKTTASRLFIFVAWLFSGTYSYAMGSVVINLASSNVERHAIFNTFISDKPLLAAINDNAQGGNLKHFLVGQTDTNKSYPCFQACIDQEIVGFALGEWQDNGGKHDEEGTINTLTHHPKFHLKP